MKKALTKIKILLIILAMVVSFIGSAYARTVYYFDSLPGLVAALDCDMTNPLCYNDEMNSGNLAIDTDDTLFIEIVDGSKEFTYNLEKEDDFNIDSVTMMFLLTNNTGSIASVEAGSDNEGLTRTLKVTLVAEAQAGVADLRILAKSDRIKEGYKDIKIAVGSECNDPIDTFYAAVPLSGGVPAQTILCDGPGENDNYLIGTKEQLLHLSYYQGDTTIGPRILSGNYRLVNDIAFDINFTTTSAMSGGFLTGITNVVNSNNVDWDGDGSADEITTEGWLPLGTSAAKFTGTFDGQGYAISNLYINAPSYDYQGFFGYTDGSTISDLGIEDNYVSGYECVGGLVGYANNTTISSSYATGAVSSGDGYAGGLVGYAYDGTTITSSYATGSVSSNDGYVGGLVGRIYTEATITSSYATGAVSGGDGYATGGLVGYSYHGTTITSSYATGSVSSNNGYVGGLVGKAYSRAGTLYITNSYATGAVRGDADVGGLVGYADYGVIIIYGYATGAVSGINRDVGGLVGESEEGSVFFSYATGNVSGADNVGGLVGTGEDSIIMYSYATGAVSGSSDVGGLLGDDDGGTITSSYAINSSLTAIGDGTAFDTSNYCSVGFDTGCDALKIRSGESGIVPWSDDVWEDLRIADNKPKLEWETDGDVTTEAPWPAENSTACGSTDNPFEGMETDGDVYLIANENQLLCLSQMQVVYSDVLSQDYRLTANIDFSSFADRAEEARGITYTLDAEGTISNLSNNVDWNGDGAAGDTEGWLPLGSDSVSFTGTFDGNGKTITNLYINRSSDRYQGLFRSIYGATISDLGLVNNYVSGYYYVGGLAGSSYVSTITSSYATGAVSGGGNIGGLVGYVYTGTITSSYVKGAVSGISSIGGLVGYARGTITNSYATGSVSGTGSNIGGLVGYAYQGTITNSYAYWSVAPTGTSYVGGLVGYSSNSTINNEGPVCENAGLSGVATIGSYTCDNGDASALTNITAIQSGGSYDAWSSSVWSGLGNPEPTLIGVGGQ